jgi:hypothetical protein
MEMIMRNNLRPSAIAVATTVALFSGCAYAADVTTAGDLNTTDKWYGRAGGLIGADQVNRLTARKVGISHDAAVAARTNMSRREGSSESLGVSYDADVAARTNMLPREAPSPTATAQPILGTEIK